MATMKDPRWALMLAGALVVAGCAATAVDAAPTLAADAASLDTAVALAVAPTIPLEDEALRALAAMEGPVAEDGTIGDGCALAEGEPLPDGAWFGLVTGVDQATITFDVACVYGPDTDQYVAFAQVEDDSPRGYAVVNDVVEERSAHLTDATQVYLEAQEWSAVDAAAALPALDPGVAREHIGVWVVVEDGKVASIVEPATQGPPAQ